MTEAAVYQHPDIGNIVEEIHIDTSLIPPWTRDNLCRDVLGLVRKIRKDPELSRKLDERIAAAREAAKTATEK